jgi:hypothetical protein
MILHVSIRLPLIIMNCFSKIIRMSSLVVTVGLASDQTRIIRVEFAWEFSQLSCPSQTRTFEELHWESTGYYRARSINSYQLSLKFEPAQNWQDCMRVDESYLVVKREPKLQLSSTLDPSIVSWMSTVWRRMVNKVRFRSSAGRFNIDTYNYLKLHDIWYI